METTNEETEKPNEDTEANDVSFSKLNDIYLNFLVFF
jgi:hypothetical protein